MHAECSLHEWNVTRSLKRKKYDYTLQYRSVVLKNRQMMPNSTTWGREFRGQCPFGKSIMVVVEHGELLNTCKFFLFMGVLVGHTRNTQDFLVAGLEPGSRRAATWQLPVVLYCSGVVNTTGPKEHQSLRSKH